MNARAALEVRYGKEFYGTVARAREYNEILDEAGVDFDSLEDYFEPKSGYAISGAQRELMKGTVTAAKVSVELSTLLLPGGLVKFSGESAPPLLRSVPNKGGGRVWLAYDLISQDDFAHLVSAGVDRGQRVTILTGTHGTKAGGLIRERAFFDEDLAAWASQTNNVKIIDVTNLSPRQLQLVLNRDGSIICAWCDSASSIAVKSARK